MPHVHLKVNIGADDDNWLAGVSTDFSDTEFKILATHPVDDGVLELVEVTTPVEDAIVRRFDESPEVRSYEVLHSDEGMVLTQLVFPMPSTYEARITTGNLPRLPLIIRDGWIAGELIGSQEQLSEFTTALAAADIPYEIVSVTQSDDASGLLTERQREVITEAVERGYYDSPRGCTLIELAETLEVNQSAASGVLHRAEGRIIKEFIS
ncbi:helix-turn-helix domain-containing protein [Natronosalvus rutilus]|uniref:Helix-turn-helix domain-containing protein n=1 Tax=Natronosalvus rutilus TaxID=2953753 RepID=A0A9E7ND52_9EURY|nr:helix-turn-helix domain-containing protein [Natronosalvus rutilus]UTF54770.1 helix-turn-helix domain-containing protein [Natronosalvus rutilus]